MTTTKPWKSDRREWKQKKILPEAEVMGYAKVLKKDSEAVIRYAGYQKDKAEREKKGRKRRLKQVTWPIWARRNSGFFIP